MTNKKKASVEIVIPIYNEEEELEQNVLKLNNYLKKSLADYSYKIVIADNASTDKSLEIAKSLAKKNKRVECIHLDRKGRGRAVKKAWRKSGADVVAYMDVDLSTDLKSFPSLVSAIVDKNYDIAIGSRLLPKSRVKNRSVKREFLSRGYNILIKLAFGTSFSDAQCGFKAVNRKVVYKLADHVKDNAWFFDSEFLILAEKLGYKIYEEPVYWIDNPGSTVRVLPTVYGDLSGLWRLFINRPWEKLSFKLKKKQSK